MYYVSAIAVVGAYIVSIFSYTYMYYVHSPVEQAEQWQYGYKQAIEVIKAQSDDKQVIMTYAYDQPYVYILFYNPIDPLWYQTEVHKSLIDRAYRSFGKYEFRPIRFEEDKKLQNVILVGTPAEIPEGAPGIIAEIPFPDGRIAFRIIAL